MEEVCVLCSIHLSTDVYLPEALFRLATLSQPSSFITMSLRLHRDPFLVATAAIDVVAANAQQALPSSDAVTSNVATITSYASTAGTLYDTMKDLVSSLDNLNKFIDNVVEVCSFLLVDFLSLTRSRYTRFSKLRGLSHLAF